jgi:hypothetical protein
MSTKLYKFICAEAVRLIFDWQADAVSSTQKFVRGRLSAGPMPSCGRCQQASTGIATTGTLIFHFIDGLLPIR